MCEYCGCRSIEVIGRFSREHDDVLTRLGNFGRACDSGDLEAVGRTGVALAEMLWPHTKAEEAGLFHEMRKEPEFTETIDSLCHEHASLDDQLERIIDGDLDEFLNFEIALRRHIDHEENGLFPAALIGVDGEMWERINARTHEFDHAAGVAHSHDDEEEHSHGHDHAHAH